MTFTTLTFLLLLTLVFSLHWTLRNRTHRNLVLICASYYFYAWWDPRYCALMMTASLLDFSAGIALERTDRPCIRKLILLVAMSGNLTMLGFFKYFDFFSANIAAAASSLGWPLQPIELHLVLPVGISFYTFQTMSYTIDIYRRQSRATTNLIDYMAFVTFFPQLAAGPIERARVLLPQFTHERHFDVAAARDGCRQILWGFFKKLALADNLSLIVDSHYSHAATMTGPQLFFATVCFAFQIYCDFSAYSDIAIGTARLFGVRLMRNFAYPYFSQSMAEFWRRWHISLSTWFRDYVYIPLGGSRATTRRMVACLLITFLLSGFWHGAAWTFLVWGAINGLATLPSLLGKPGRRLGKDDVPGGEALVPSPGVVLRIAGTFALTCLCWVFFRAGTMNNAVLILRKIATDAISPGLWLKLSAHADAPRSLWPILGFMIAFEWVQRRHPHPLASLGGPRWLHWGLFTAIAWITLLLIPRETGPFIYFQF